MLAYHCALPTQRTSHRHHGAAPACTLTRRSLPSRTARTGKRQELFLPPQVTRASYCPVCTTPRHRRVVCNWPKKHQPIASMLAPPDLAGPLRCPTARHHLTTAHTGECQGSAAATGDLARRHATSGLKSLCNSHYPPELREHSAGVLATLVEVGPTAIDSFWRLSMQFSRPMAGGGRNLLPCRGSNLLPSPALDSRDPYPARQREYLP